MQKNMGSIDRELRFFGAGFFALLYPGISPSGTPAVILGIVTIALLVTGSIGFCPMYAMLKVSTGDARRGTKEEAAR